LHALGGDCLDDFARLREESGLPQMLGHALPSPEVARKFLYQFHDEQLIEAARQQLPLGQVAYIPGENAALQGLARVNDDLLCEMGRRAPHKIATVDQDSTIIESHKREARPTYAGGCGYQPMLAVWAETDLVLADEFRDGNVPAMQNPLAVAQAAFQALPESVEEYYYRGDSACHEHALMDWLRDEQRVVGPRQRIGFAISARMSAALKEAVRQLPESAWQSWRSTQERGEDRAWAELPFVPGEHCEHKDRPPLRYVALRIRARQGQLFADGSEVKHFAVVTNLWNWEGQRLLEWHREKAGTIEGIHHVLKHELGAGVLPCGRFGANAAWLRLAVLTHNVLTALKRLALPPEFLAARPKRLRFLIFHTAGRLVGHARQMILRVATTVARLRLWLDALRVLPMPA